MTLFRTLIKSPNTELPHIKHIIKIPNEIDIFWEKNNMSQNF